MDLGVKPMSFPNSNALWRSVDGVSVQFPAGLRVLAVDDDPTCLRILEKMLKNCLYKVTTCNRAEIALDFLRDSRNVYDIVISDVHMPDMDGFKLLEHVGLEMDLPVIMMSADDSKDVVMKGVTHGACDYLIKPVRMEALKNIWQHVVRKKKHEWKEKGLEHSGSIEEQKTTEDLDYSSSGNEGNWGRSKKRKDEEDGVLEDRDDTSALKKPRVVWSVELHQQFVAAVNRLGIDKAVPKKILELMNVPGLTRENVASHLQKYRLYLRRLSRVSQHHNGLPNTFIGPPDFPFGPTSSLDAVKLQALAASCQLPPQSLASIQAAALGRATAKNTIPSPPLVDQRKIFSFENRNLRFLDVHPQQNNNNDKQVDLLHGIPINIHVRPHASQSISLPVSIVRPQNLNEVNSSVSQPISGRTGVDNVRVGQRSPVVDFSSQSMDVSSGSLSRAKNTGMLSHTWRPREEVNSSVSQPISGRTGVDNVRVGQPSPVVDFSSQSMDVSSSRLSLAKNTGILSHTWRPREEVNASRGFVVRNYDVNNRVASSGAEGLENTTIVGRQVNSSFADNPLRTKVEREPNFMGIENGFLYEHFDQEDLMSALLKEQQEGVGTIENEFGFDSYYLDDLPV